MPVSQDNRLLSIDASFLKGDAIVTELQGTEYFSRPFTLMVTILCGNHNLTSADVIGQKCAVTLNHQDTSNPRYFHGRINGISLGGLDGDQRQYRLRLVPGFWFTSQAQHQRIYEEMSAKDIISAILSDYGDFCQFEDNTSASYLTREYCVQYGETDFEFVSRLMEEEGISYYFKHEASQHTMVLCDSTSGYTDCEQKNARLNVGSDFDSKAGILSWHREMNFHSGAFEMTDYNHDTPKNFYKQTLATKHQFAQSPAQKTMHEFAGYQFSGSGQAQHDFDVNANKHINGVRLESLEAAHDIARGSGYCGSFFAGGRFPLDHHIKSESNTYVITEISHSAHNKNDQMGEYRNQFSCIPADVVFRAPQNTVKKVMNGPLTAKVVELNASTSQTDADPHRMIRVEFPWSDQAKSCWLRVAQAYAGAGWGGSFVPRLNQEVLVEFINGDPDRPLVVGALYNKDNQGPAYTSTQSGFKTASKQFNELRFDDKDSAEEIYVEAGKDYNYLVHNNDTGTVQNDQSLTVGNDRNTSVGNNHSESVGADQTVDVGGNQDTSVGGDQSMAVSGNQTMSITGDQSLTVTGGHTLDATGAISTTSKQSIKLQANMSIELAVGGNSIKIDPTGVTITGTMVKINGSAMTEVKGGGMLKMQGGMVMIN